MSGPTPFPPDFSIPTPRLNIHPFDPTNLTHCAFLVELWNTDDFISSCGRTGVDTPEKAAEFIQRRIIADYNRNGYGTFLLSQQTDMKLVGTVSLMKGAPPGPHYLAPDVGYAILPEQSGKGYATEAALALLGYAKTALGIDAVFGFCDAGNKRSCRVLEKLGMEFKGVRSLKVFGGGSSAVYILPGMSQDLSVYGLED